MIQNGIPLDTVTLAFFKPFAQWEGVGHLVLGASSSWPQWPSARCTIIVHLSEQKPLKNLPLEVKDLRQTSSIRKKPEADLGFKKQQLDIF